MIPGISTWHDFCSVVFCGVPAVPPTVFGPAIAGIAARTLKGHHSCTLIVLRRPLLASAKLAALLLFTGAALGIARPAAAQQFKITARGTITSVTNTEGLLNSSVAVGTAFTSSFLFDYSVPDLSMGNPSFGSYALNGANAGATSVFGDYTFAPGPASINSIGIEQYPHGGPANRLYLQSQGGTVTGFSVPVRTIENQIQLFDYAGLLSSTALPPLSTYGVFPLSSPTFFTTAFQAREGVNVSRVTGSITSLKAELVSPNVAPVPEASTTISLGLMLGLGGLVLAVRRRKIASR